MIEFFLINRVIIALINFIGLWFALWVYLANPKLTINKIFSVVAFLTLIWVDFVYLANTAQAASVSIFWTKLSEGTVLLLLLSLYFFAVYFPRELKRPLILGKVVLFLVITLLFFILFTDFITKDVVEVKGWGFSPVPGQIWFLFNGTAFFITILVLYFLLKGYNKLLVEEKLKVQYFLVGFFIFVIANIVFNILLPVYYNNYQFVQLGTNSAIFLLGFTAFAIVKRELFGIRVILTQILVGAIAILLLVQAVTASGWDLVWKFALFLIFLPFGYFLIQSVIREIQRRTELQKLYEQVDKLSRAKSEFISIASHQLRTPLTAIKGYISMLIEGTYGKLTGRTIPPMEKVYQSNERLIKLVNDLLHVSRIESGTLRIDLQKTSLEDIISSVVDELRIKADERKIYLKWEKPPKPLPEITVDADKFRQVILNIIDNCIKYTEKGGITVATEQKKSSVKFPQGSILTVIKDTGEGMTEEEIEKMFESFSRGKAGAKHWTAGTGLGLYIARKFTEIHGGRVWAESPGEGKGSTFYVELPVK